MNNQETRVGFSPNQLRKKGLVVEGDHGSVESIVIFDKAGNGQKLPIIPIVSTGFNKEGEPVIKTTFKPIN